MILRDCTAYLKEWKSRITRKPLIIRGARQIGKSYLVRELFAPGNFHNLAEVNLEQHPELGSLFSSRDPDLIIQTLESLLGMRIEDGQTLLFLDEVQSCPEVLACLRYFYEKRPELHVIAAGSLLEFALSDFDYSVPVGRVEYLYLEPLSLNEFLPAVCNELLAKWPAGYHVGDTVPDALHQKLLEYVRLFWLTGGLPEAVQVYSQTGSLIEVERIQQTLITTFQEDFAKYRRRVPKELLQLVYTAIARQLGQKFMFTMVSRDYRSRELGGALHLLSQAKLVDCVCATAANGLPLGTEADTRNFKAYGLDIGLCARQLGLSISSLQLPFDDDFISNRGGFCEQFVAQMLKCAEPRHIEHRLYHWVRNTPNSNAEVDFLLPLGERIVPVEVKAGTTGRMKSLHRFLIEKKTAFAIRFNGDKPSFVETTFTDEKGNSYPFQLLSLPFYLIGQVRRLAEEALQRHP